MILGKDEWCPMQLARIGDAVRIGGVAVRINHGKLQMRVEPCLHGRAIDHSVRDDGEQMRGLDKVKRRRAKDEVVVDVQEPDFGAIDA